MQLVGQKATKWCAHKFCLLSCTATSLSWLPSGVTVIYKYSTGAQVAATVQAASECGQFMAIKYEVNAKVVHHLRAPAHRIKLRMGSPSPGITSKPSDITRNDWQTTKHHQELPAHIQTPPGNTSKGGPQITTRKCLKASKRHQVLP